MKKKIFVITEIWMKQIVVEGESKEKVINNHLPSSTNLDFSNWHAIEVNYTRPPK